MRGSVVIIVLAILGAGLLISGGVLGAAIISKPANTPVKILPEPYYPQHQLTNRHPHQNQLSLPSRP